MWKATLHLTQTCTYWPLTSTETRKDQIRWHRPWSWRVWTTIGIKHNFSFINIRKVPREMLKTEGEARGFQHLPGNLANVNEWQNHVWSLLLHKSTENTPKVEKIVAHFILQPYHSLALFTYSHVLFINARIRPWSGSYDYNATA